MDYSMHSLRLLTILVMLTALNNVALGRTLNVPEDHQTIQAGIDAAEEGDTVLVQPGTYEEAINFGGKPITVAGTHLLTCDPEDIKSTIIDSGGRLNRSVVRFDSAEDENSRLTGLTLMRGLGSDDLDGDLSGGGIHCLEASPSLDHLIITRCHATFGGGIFIQIGSPSISDIIITRNHAWQSGGGIYCSREGTNPVITRTIITFDSTNTWGLSFGCYGGARPTLINCTIHPTQVRNSSAISAYDSNYIKLINCSVYAAYPINLGWDNQTDTLEATYTHFFTEENFVVVDRSTLILGEGNVFGEPLFADSLLGDFTPTWSNFPENDETKSPLIDVGDPNSPEDPDGTRADIGAIPFKQGCNVIGTVRRHRDNATIVGAILSATGGTSDTSDGSGEFILRNVAGANFEVLVRAAGYIDTTIVDLHGERLETLELNIRLRNGQLYYNGEDLELSLDTNQSGQVAFNIENLGNAALLWKADTRPAGEFGFDVGQTRDEIAVADLIGVDRVYAGAFVDGYYYVPTYDNNSTEKKISVFDSHGEFSHSFDQPPIIENRYGIRSLTWDGAIFWGVANSDTLFSFTIEGDPGRMMVVPGRNSPTNITWDPVDSLFWVSNISGSLLAYDPELNEVIQAIEYRGLRKYGLGFYPEDPDNHPLYILANSGENPRYRLYKMNPVDGDTILIQSLDSTVLSASGAFVVPGYDRFLNSVVLISTGINRPVSIQIIQIDKNRHWASVTPSEGLILPGEFTWLTLLLDATDLIPEFYPGEIRFDHNALGLQQMIPFLLTVTPLSIPSDNLPSSTFDLLSAFPNPFNSMLRIQYLQSPHAIANQMQSPHAIAGGVGGVSLTIYDLSGRLVADLLDPLHSKIQTPNSKLHTAIWNTSAAPAGVYLVRLQSGTEISTQKVVLMR